MCVKCFTVFAMLLCDTWLLIRGEPNTTVDLHSVCRHFLQSYSTTASITHSSLDQRFPLVENSSVLAVNETEEFPLDERVLEGVALLVICMLAIGGNLTLWVVVIRTPDLHSAASSLLLCLSAADLLVSIVNMPLTVATIFIGRWVFSDGMCVATGFSNMLTFVGSVMSLCLITLNRYIRVCRPHLYRTVYSRKAVTLHITGVWLLSTALSVPPLFGWSEYRYLHRQFFCYCHWRSSLSYTVFMVAFCFGGTSSLMTSCYIAIHRKFTRSKRVLSSKTSLSNAATSGQQSNLDLDSGGELSTGDLLTSASNPSLSGSVKKISKANFLRKLFLKSDHKVTSSMEEKQQTLNAGRRSQDQERLLQKTTTCQEAMAGQDICICCARNHHDRETANSTEYETFEKACENNGHSNCNRPTESLHLKSGPVRNPNKRQPVINISSNQNYPECKCSAVVNPERQFRDENNCSYDQDHTRSRGKPIANSVHERQPCRKGDCAQDGLASRRTVPFSTSASCSQLSGGCTGANRIKETEVSVHDPLLCTDNIDKETTFTNTKYKSVSAMQTNQTKDRDCDCTVHEPLLDIRQNDEDVTIDDTGSDDITDNTCLGCIETNEQNCTDNVEKINGNCDTSGKSSKIRIAANCEECVTAAENVDESDTNYCYNDDEQSDEECTETDKNVHNYVDHVQMARLHVDNGDKSCENSCTNLKPNLSYLRVASLVHVNTSASISSHNAAQRSERRRREEIRLTSTMLLVILVYVISWLPYCITILMNNFLSETVPRQVDMMTLLMGYANSLYNPFIYGWRNSNIRRGYIQLFRDIRRVLCSVRPKSRKPNVVFEL